MVVMRSSWGCTSRCLKVSPRVGHRGVGGWDIELLVRGALQKKKMCTSDAAWLCQESLKYQHITTLHARRTAPYMVVRTRPLPTRDACYDRGSKHTLAEIFF